MLLTCCSDLIGTESELTATLVTETFQLFSDFSDFVCKSASLPGYGRNGIQRVRP